MVFSVNLQISCVLWEYRQLEVSTDLENKNTPVQETKEKNGQVQGSLWKSTGLSSSPVVFLLRRENIEGVSKRFRSNVCFHTMFCLLFLSSFVFGATPRKLREKTLCKDRML